MAERAPLDVREAAGRLLAAYPRCGALPYRTSSGWRVSVRDGSSALIGDEAAAAEWLAARTRPAGTCDEVRADLEHRRARG